MRFLTKRAGATALLLALAGTGLAACSGGGGGSASVSGCEAALRTAWSSGKMTAPGINSASALLAADPGLKSACTGLNKGQQTIMLAWFKNYVLKQTGQ